MNNTEIELTIVAPMYNEAENIETTINKIQETMQEFDKSWEFIFVNDGSTDNTLKIAKEFEKQIENLRVVSYYPNYGRGKAIRTGIDSAKGKYIVTIDFDLSYSPDHILRLYKELKNDNSLDTVLASVYMPGGKTIGVAPFRLFLSKYGNKIIRLGFKENIYTATCVVRGYKASVIKSLELYSDDKEIHLEILSKLFANEAKVKEIPATLTRREKGTSKFKFKKTSITHLLFTVFERPAYFLSIMGIFLMTLGTILGLYSVYLRVVGELVEGRPLLYLIVLLLILGGQFLSFGIIAGQNSFLRDEIYKLQTKIKQLKQDKNV